MLEIRRFGSLTSKVICNQISMAANEFCQSYGLFNLTILQINFLQKATLALHICKLKPIMAVIFLPVSHALQLCSYFYSKHNII